MMSSAYCIEYVNEQLDSIERAPEMWGPPLAVELQYLLLLEFYVVTAAPEVAQSNPRYVRELFAEFVQAVAPDAQTKPLSTAVPNPVALAGELARFREIVRERSPHPPFPPVCGEGSQSDGCCAQQDVVPNTRFALDSLLPHGDGQGHRCQRFSWRAFGGPHPQPFPPVWGEGSRSGTGARGAPQAEVPVHRGRQESTIPSPHSGGRARVGALQGATRPANSYEGQGGGSEQEEE